MLCKLVIVPNARPCNAHTSARATILMLPGLILLFPALVIRQRVASTDQKQLLVSSTSSCLSAAALGIALTAAAYFRKDIIVVRVAHSNFSPLSALYHERAHTTRRENR
jgi:hypothetical protein